MLGLYFSAEFDTGSGAMIALVAAVIFGIVAICQIILQSLLRPKDNL